MGFGVAKATHSFIHCGLPEENAMINGIQIMLDARVTGIRPDNNHTFAVETTKGSIRTRFVVNAAGLFTDEVARMVGQDEFNIPGIFTGGNVVQVHDLVDDVILESEVAGCSAAKYVLGEIPISTVQISLRAGKGIRYVVPNSITSENNVTLYMRVVKPDKNVVLRIGDSLLEKRLPAIKPSEMLKG